MTMTVTVEDLTGANGAVMGEAIEEPAPVAHEVVTRGAPLVLPTLAMSAACLATVMIASAMERGSPWAGINAVTAGIGLSGRRPPAHFDPVITLAGVGMVIGGSLVGTAIVNRAAPRIRGGRPARALLASLVSVGLDRVLVRNAIFPAFRSALGIGGTVVKYASIGIAHALASRS